VTCSNLYIGYSGANGGGLIISNSAADFFSNRFVYVGYSASAGADGTIIQYSGIVTSSAGLYGYAMYLGYTAGRTGRYIMNGGNISYQPCWLIVGRAGFGEMELNGGTMNIYGVYLGMSKGTGTVVQAGGSNYFYVLGVGGYDAANYGRGIYRLHGGYMQATTLNVGKGGVPCRGDFIQNGGTNVPASLNIGDSGGHGCYVLSNGFLKPATICLPYANNDGTLEIKDGIITNSSLIFYVPYQKGTGTVIQTGGKFYVNTAVYVGGYGDAATVVPGNLGIYHMSNGLLQVASATFYVGKDTGTVARFYQYGGLVTNSSSIYLGGSTTNSADALYEIRGGTSHFASLIYTYSSTAVFRVRGPDPVVRVSYFSNAYNNANWESVLDGKPEHIAASYWNSTGRSRGGYLKVGLNGGILLAKTNAFDLLTAPTLSTAAYASTPDTNLWATTTNASFADATRTAVRITLTNSLASLNMNGTKTASFSARARGYVTLANFNTNLMDEGLAVYLNLDATTYGNTLTNLVAQLITAGYTNSAAESSGLRAVIPKSYLTTNNPSYFVWDFTDVSTGVTNATVSSLRFLNWPATPGTVITIR
jgi:hypothetical protein